MKMRFGPAGVHLFDRATGMNYLFSDLIPPASMWTRTPRNVSIALTNSCDLSCDFCYAPKTPSKLSSERVLAWATELDNHGTIGVGFGGGEPTLFPNFEELCQTVGASTRLSISFTTHGHHLSTARIDRLRESVNFVRVSVDGIGRTYERIRGRSFEAVHGVLSALSGRISFGINYVVNADTIADLDAAAHFAESLGAVELLLLPERSSLGVIPLITTTLNGWVSNYSGGLRLAISATEAAGLPICDPLGSEVGLAAYAHIDAQGVLKRTSFDTDGVRISQEGVMAAIQQLRMKGQ